MSTHFPRLRVLEEKNVLFLRSINQFAIFLWGYFAHVMKKPHKLFHKVFHFMVPFLKISLAVWFYIWQLWTMIENYTRQIGTKIN